MSLFLVTGGAGFIGSNICKALLENGHKVRVLDNLVTGKMDNINSFINDIDFINGDIRDQEIVRKAVTGTDFVLHHAAISSVQYSIMDPVFCSDVNTQGTLNLLCAARDTGVKRVVFASSASVYGQNEIIPKKEDMKAEPASPYAVTKYNIEVYARIFYSVYGLETVCLRYFNVFGPNQDPRSSYSGVISLFIKALREGNVIEIFGDGEQTRDFIYIEDVVRANLLAVASDRVGKGEVINIATGVGKSLNELISILSAITGVNPEIAYSSEKKGDIRHSKADIELAKKLLNFEAKVSLEKGLKGLYGINN
ncbi:MAG: SDR family oxidoreductase [Ignavibacteriales bacterium]